MDNKIATKTKHSHIQYGVFYGILMILGFVLVYILNIDPIKDQMIGRFQSVCSYFIFPVILMFFGIKEYKKNNLGFISISECLKIGVSVAFIGAFMLALFNVVFNILFPEYLETILVQTKQIMLLQNPNLTQSQIESGIAMTRKFSSPFLSFPFTLLLFSFLGLIYSLIIGLIVRNENPQFN